VTPPPVPGPVEADKLDEAVYQVLEKLKAGNPVRLPGLGVLRPGPERSVLFDCFQGGRAKEGAHARKKPGRR